VSTIAERAVALRTALADYPDLPHAYMAVGETYARISVSMSYSSLKFNGIREVAQWAEHFGTEMILSLSSGMADAQTDIVLGGVPVSVEASFGTAMAYELGRILQRELNRDVSIHIGPEELLAAIDQVVAS